MNLFLVRELSVYQLALGLQMHLQPLPVSPATVLSMLRSQIDLLIEHQIAATLYVKLPPGNIWHAQVQRYQSAPSKSSVVRISLTQTEGDKENISPKSQREYFLMVLSPQFCSLIAVQRLYKDSQVQNFNQENFHKIPPLSAIATFEGKIIQRVLDGIKKAALSESTFLPADFVCPSVPEPVLINQLFAKQLTNQDEIYRQISNKRIDKLEKQKLKLHSTLQLQEEYVNNVCQELRTPLTHMKTALSLLNSPNIKIPQRQRYLQMVNTQCDRQNTLIASVLELTQLEHNLKTPVLEEAKLSEIVPGVVSTYQPLAQEKGIMLAYTVPTELPAVWCVAGGIKQIVIHLLSNSIKFSSTGGKVWVKARSQGNFVQLEFRDTGIGIAENDINKIFDRFYRIRPAAGGDDSTGAGLGLTVVQQLLLHSGGSISVKSKLNEGSIFTIQLPASNSSADKGT